MWNDGLLVSDLARRQSSHRPERSVHRSERQPAARGRLAVLRCKHTDRSEICVRCASQNLTYASHRVKVGHRRKAFVCKLVSLSEVGASPILVQGRASGPAFLPSRSDPFLTVCFALTRMKATRQSERRPCIYTRQGNSSAICASMPCRARAHYYHDY